LREQTPSLSVRQLCELLQVNRRWYYQHRHPSARARAEVVVRESIEQLVLAFPGYGYRRVTEALGRAGERVNHKRVLRIMREESWLCQLKRRFVPTTDSEHDCPVYPNLLKEREVQAPNEVWVADITYIRLRRAFVYLACVLDAYSRKCLGWHLSRHIDADLALAALNMALASRCIHPGLIHHSDRGVQYASHAYVERLQQVGAQISMSALGNPYDNAKAERFFRTLKQEEVYLKEYQTLQDAQENIDAFLRDVYNAKRLHSSLGYRPPDEFESLYYATFPL
jgi:transposase InsO family protein